MPLQSGAPLPERRVFFRRSGSSLAIQGTTGSGLVSQRWNTHMGMPRCGRGVESRLD
jgi:hypothetical protein